MISIQHLNKRFRKHTVLKDISLEFPNGTVTAVIGPNGSGKTTLMKSILGLITPDSGSIIIDGVSAIDNAESRKSVGYMAQIARYPENLTAREVIAMVRGLRDISLPDNSDALIEQFDLTVHLDKPMRMLSGGTRQKVGAIVALMFGPHSLLLDEPTAGLDPISSQRLKDMIVEAKDKGATVLITSHILSEIDELADRVMYLHEGKCIYYGEIQTLLTRTGESSLTRAIATLMDESPKEPA